MDIIKEETFLVGDKPWIKNGFDSYFTSRDDIDEWTAKCIYAETGGEIKVITASMPAPPAPEERGTGFASYLKEYKPRSFKEILFLLDLYPVTIEDAIKEHKPFKSIIGRAIEEILKETRGIILWHYQMESILSLFIRDNVGVVTVRKGINAKKPDTLHTTHITKIDKRMSLEKVIRQRMRLGHTKYPNVKGALVVYEILRKGKDNRDRQTAS
ncbi:MAG: hypothetical protein HZB81_07035 [Deltaproteobacteria bacterium]|nr:hypothetical protein [Deltaproteobacteria bacterium]